MSRTPAVPSVDVPAAIVSQIVGLGGTPEAANNPLYRALANNPDQLTGWIELAWRLRTLAKTPARLRELMILHGARLSNCEFEAIGHTLRARAAGVGDDVIAQVAGWRDSDAFSEDERLALRLMEEIVAGAASDETMAQLRERFDVEAQLELILTASFYVMVPRVIESLRLVREPLA